MKRPLSDLRPDLALQLRGLDLIVFDGTCVLCSYFYRLVLRFDRAAHFRFATARSPLGQALYAALDLPKEEFETNLVITSDHIFGELDSVAATCRRLGGLWTLGAVLHLLPQFIKGPIYRLIAHNRFRLFGRFDTCMVPTPEDRARFIERGL
ncbi:MAG: DCC1-like thiol-disulfide oxidoreductase family protein [Pseudomonadota bacterium]